MKPSNRVHKNGNTAIVIPQSQSKRDAALAFTRKLYKAIGGRKNLAKLNDLMQAADLRALMSEIRGCADKVLNTTNSANVLFELIHAHQDWREHREGSEWDRERTDRFNYGLSRIIDHVRGETESAAEALMAVAYRKKDQPQPVSAA